MRLEARQPRQPMTPIAVPISNDTPTSTACTMRNDVGRCPAPNDRWSFQMFLRKVGQITQVHTPTASRNAETRRVITTRASVARPAAATRVGYPVSSGPMGPAGVRLLRAGVASLAAAMLLGPATAQA